MSMIWLKSRIHPYSKTAPWTKIIQPKTHVAIDVNESVSGELAVMLMNKFTKTKSRGCSCTLNGSRGRGPKTEGHPAEAEAYFCKTKVLEGLGQVALD